MLLRYLHPAIKLTYFTITLQDVCAANTPTEPKVLRPFNEMQASGLNSVIPNP